MPGFRDNQTTELQQWIIDSRGGDEAALNQLAEYLLPRAFEFANQRMQSLNAMDNYEDVAISAVKSVCLRFREGQNEFLGEKELGGLLRKFVTGKIRDRRKYHLAEKRDVNRTTGQTSEGEDGSTSEPAVLRYAVAEAESVWLDEASVSLPVAEQEYLATMLDGLGADVQGLFAELVKRLDDNPRKVLMLITTRALSNEELAESLNCAPVSIERYRKAIRRKLTEIVNG